MKIFRVLGFFSRFQQAQDILGGLTLSILKKVEIKAPSNFSEIRLLKVGLARISYYKGGLSMGLCLGWSSPAIQQLQVKSRNIKTKMY